MQGSFRAMAAHENGSLLLQVEQASSFYWKYEPYYPQIDTLSKEFGIQRTSVLALLDSSGNLRGFRSLKGLANASAWKIRRAPGRGWLLLTWDELGFFGWSRLYLLDDSLNLRETSDTLPAATDVEIGADGRILLTGIATYSTVNPAWLTGAGSMWAGQVYFQTPAVDTMPPILVAVSPTPGAMVPGPAGREITVTYRNNGVLKRVEAPLDCASGLCSVTLSDTASNGRRAWLQIPLELFSGKLVDSLRQTSNIGALGPGSPTYLTFRLGMPATCSLRVWPTVHREQPIVTLPLGARSVGKQSFSWDGTFGGNRLGDGDYGFTLVMVGAGWRDSTTSYGAPDTAWGSFYATANKTLASKGWMDISLNPSDLSLATVWIQPLGQATKALLAVGRILGPGPQNERVYNLDWLTDTLVVRKGMEYLILVHLKPIGTGLRVRGTLVGRGIGSTRWDPFLSQVVATRGGVLTGTAVVGNVHVPGTGAEIAPLGTTEQVLDPPGSVFARGMVVVRKTQNGSPNDKGAVLVQDWSRIPVKGF